MKKIALSALVLAAAAGSASAVVDPNFRLEVQLVPRIGDAATGLTDFVPDQANPVPCINVGDKLNIEIRYRILDQNTADNQSSRGLNAAVMNVSSNSAGMLSAANLTFVQATGADADSTPFVPHINPDLTGDSGDVGLHNAFRTGLGGGPGANGNFAVPGQISTILPLNTSTPNQGSTSTGSRFWSVYSFTFMPTDAGDFSFTLDVTQWSFWRRTGTTGTETNPLDGATGSSGTSTIRVKVLPAPGAAALLGLGGLIAARRRRA